MVPTLHWRLCPTGRPVAPSCAAAAAKLGPGQGAKRENGAPSSWPSGWASSRRPLGHLGRQNVAWNPIRHETKAPRRQSCPKCMHAFWGTPMGTIRQKYGDKFLSIAAHKCNPNFDAHWALRRGDFAAEWRCESRGATATHWPPMLCHCRA